MKQLLLILLFLVNGHRVFSQQYNFKHLGMDEGLNSSYVAGSVEDERGYMWIATLKGIMRYDGREFKEYGEKDGYADVGAYKIFKDRTGRLWFISFNYHLYYLENEHFHRCLPGELVGWIDEGPDGNMYAATRRGDLITFTPQKIISRFLISTAQNYYLKVLANKDKIVVNVDYVLYIKEHSIMPILIRKHELVVTRIYELKNSDVLICNEKGIYCFNPVNLTASPFFLFNSYNEVLDLYEDPVDGSLWFATIKGVYKFKHKGSANTPEIIIRQLTSGIYKSRQGNLWFTTFGDGIYYSNFQSKHYLINNHEITYLRKQGEYVYTISLNGQVSVIHNGKINKLKYGGEGEKVNLVSTSKHNDLPVYFNTHANNVWAIDQGKVYLRESHLRSKKEDKYHFFFINDKGEAYYSKRGALFRFQEKKICWYPKNGRLRQLYNSLPMEIRLAQRECFHFTDSQVYNLADNGIIKYDTKGVNNDHCEFDSSYTYGVNDALMSSGSTFIATNKLGLDIVRDHSHHLYTIANGLPSNNINKLYSDNGDLWICTNNGLARLRLNKKDSVIGVTVFNSGSVLLSNEVYDVTVSGKNVYAATGKGISVFKKDLLPHTAYIPPVYIQRVQVNNNDTIFKNGSTFLYDQNNITIAFRAISFGSNADVLYRYKLVGADDAFQSSTQDNVRYAALKPGTYTFLVYAKTENNQWSTFPAAVNFTIAPPYWLTWWFISLECIIVLTIVLSVIIIYFRSRQRRVEFGKKMVESELRSLRLHINPHFVFNSLTSLQSYVLTDRVEQASIMISRFAGLIRSFMYYSKKGEIKLKDEIALLSEYIEMEQLRFKEQFDYTIKVDSDVNIHDTLIPSLLIQPFVENAIKHGLTGLDRKGLLQVHFYKEKSQLYCSVKDNGRGRTNSHQDETFSTIHESTGIQFTTDRIRLIINDAHAVVMQMIDLYQGEESAGLEVKILVPVL